MSEESTVVESDSHDDNADSSTAPEVEVKTEVEAEAGATEKPEVPKKDRFQSRINQLTAKNHETEQRNVELESRIKALETKPAAAEEPDLVAPNPNDFDTDQEYQTANAQYYAEVAGNAADARVNANNEATAQANERQTQQDSIKAKKSAFEEKLDSKRGHFEDFEDVAYGHQFMDMDLAEQIFDLDKGPEVAYHLGSNLDEAARIFALAPVQRARELTKLEFQVEALKPKVVSDAPDPITTLGNSESVDEVGVNGENLSTDEWQKWRNKQVHG